MESTRDRLRKVPLFRELEDESLDRLAGLSSIVHVKKKEILFHEGDPYRGMFIVLRGLAVVFKTSADGRMLILRVCREGSPLAELQLFEPGTAGYLASARCTRDSEILMLPQAAFTPFLKQHPEVAWEMLHEFAGRLKQLNLQLEGVTLREVSSRLAQYLLREVEAAGQEEEPSPSMTLPLAKGAITSYLGTVHETLSRTFARLVREKVIKVDGPRITILDKDKLKRMV